MGGMVEAAVRRSVRALVDRDEAQARRVLETEDAVDQMEIEIDKLCTRLLVLQQPVARDLRFLTSALKINTDLERMGDLAAQIASRSLGLLKLPPNNFNIDIPYISSLVESMMLKCLDAFVKEDADMANEVLAADDEVDRVRNDAYQKLVRQMQTDPESVQTAVELIFIIRNLERIGDHATNIAEDVIYFSRGIDVRHQ